MNISSGIYKDYNNNFLLDESKFRKIVDVIRANSNKLPYKTYIEFYVEQVQDSFFSTDDIDDVLQDDNTKDKAFRTILIQLFKSEPEKKTKQSTREPKAIVSVAFTSEKEIKARFSISCEDRDWALLMADELDTQIRRTFTSKPFVVPSFVVDGIIAFIIFCVGIYFASWIAEQYAPTSLSNSEIAMMTMEEQISKILEISANRNTNFYVFLYIRICTYLDWSRFGFNDAPNFLSDKKIQQISFLLG